MMKTSLSLAAGVLALTVAAHAAQTTVQDPGNVVGTGTNAWSYLVVEGEDYASETDDSPGVGFTRAQADGAIVSFLGNPILSTNTAASKKGALYIQPAAKHGDKATYQMQFAKAGTYYMYMRFTISRAGPATPTI